MKTLLLLLLSLPLRLHSKAARPMARNGQDAGTGSRAPLRLHGALVLALTLLALLFWSPGPAPAVPGGLTAPHHSLADHALSAGQAVLERALASVDGPGPAPVPVSSLPAQAARVVALPRRASRAPATAARHRDAAPRAPPVRPA